MKKSITSKMGFIENTIMFRNFAKQIAIVCTAVIMTAGTLTGCQSSSNTVVDEKQNQLGVSETEEQIEEQDELLLIVQRMNDTGIAMQDAAVAEAEGAGYCITAYDAWNNAEKQLNRVKRAVEENTKAILIDMVDPNNAQAILDAAGGIPVVFVDTAPTDMEILNAENAAYCGSDEAAAGYMQGEYLANYFIALNRTQMHCIWLKNEQDQDKQEKRTAGVRQALEDYGITAVSVIEIAGKGDRTDTMNQIKPILTSDITFDCIIANDDAMALGAMDACVEIGIDPATFPIVGIDCTEAGAEAIAEGKMAMTASKNFEGQGKGAVQAALNLLHGVSANGYTSYEADDSEESYSDSIIWVPFRQVTANNVMGYMDK